MSELYEKTLELIDSTEVPMPEIAKKAGVGYRWLCDLKARRFSDPGVKKIERIHKLLSDNGVAKHEHME